MLMSLDVAVGCDFLLPFKAEGGKTKDGKEVKLEACRLRCGFTRTPIQEQKIKTWKLLAVVPLSSHRHQFRTRSDCRQYYEVMFE